MSHIPDAGKMPDVCPFCGAGVLILEDGQECRTPDGSHLAFQCFTNWFRDRPADRTDECVKAERNNLIAERDRLRGRLEKISDDEAWAHEHRVLVYQLQSGWESVWFNDFMISTHRATAPTIAEALRALRAKCEEGRP